MIGDLLQEIRLAVRSLGKRPGFTLVAVLTLALGMAASTTIFSVFDAVLLRPLPYPNQDRLLDLREVDEKGKAMRFAEPNFDDLRAQSRSFESIAKYSGGPEAVAGGSEPVRANVSVVSSDFFRVLGVTPVLGRVFSPEAVMQERQVAVVSYGFWKRLLGGRASLDGTSLRIGHRSFSVIGVLPADVEFPAKTDVWCPAEIYPPVPSRTAHNWRAIGRLREGVTIEQARGEIGAIGRQLKQAFGRETDAASFGAAPLRERIVKDVRGVLLVLCGAVAVLLLIACSNVANLLLVRAASRRKEIALRAALGASRTQLARQFIIEALLLTLLAGTVGILLTHWGVDLIVAFYHGEMPRLAEVGVNSSVLLFTLGVAVSVGVVLGLVPAWQAASRELQGNLQETGRGNSSGRSGRRLRSALIVAQVALTLMLLVGAGLLGRSFARLLAVNPGFQTESAVAMTVSQPDAEDRAGALQIARSYAELLRRLQTLPGMIAVGGVNALPMSGAGANGTFITEEGGKAPETMEAFSREMTKLAGTGRTGDAEYRAASGGYFAAMRIPLVRGRLFDESDGPDGQHVAVVSESLARRYWPGADPIGKQIEFGNMDGDLRLMNVVGVVGDVRDEGLDAEPRPTVYANCLQRPGRPSEFSFVVRAQGSAAALIDAMRREAAAVNPEMPTKFQTLSSVVASSLDNRRFSMVMLAIFAGAALLLASIGLYGTMAYITAERTTELGIRMALGAQRADMLRLVLTQSFTLVASGLIAGVVAALAATRVLATFLFGIGAADLVTYGAVICVLMLAALIATYLPARRAMNVDPMLALRHD